MEKITCAGCLHGVMMCQSNPCILTPEEAKNLIDKGFSDRLMIEWWDKDGDNNHPEFYFMSCAISGYEGILAPELPEDPQLLDSWTKGKCTFLNQDNLCELHDLNLKPLEGHVACCHKSDAEGLILHHAIAQQWNTPQHQEFVRQYSMQKIFQAEEEKVRTSMIFIDR
ncbi:hypothetical protein FD723_40470 (plasmid) [Nostoc sp. C052]|uniref:hypothetical protein n=1 Tax=Nostoc sp. C052 TaxID=2576902 RepID=UPI0015C2DD3D|nr:hypothetical protein [Nostoc sp. C052]QLE46489.1 hypothetical protein FD723_40470 [Nostoc sp. C052]